MKRVQGESDAKKDEEKSQKEEGAQTTETDALQAKINQSDGLKKGGKQGE